jgi:molybdopterin-dependent oxidoreductase alpha subunit
MSSGLPFGLGRVKPHHYREMLRIAWENRDSLGYAWRVLNHGVCDGCSLGPRGLKDDVVAGPHLCLTRLQLLRLNTMPALDPAVLGDVDALRRLDERALRRLGRLPYPLLRERNERGFRRVSWDDAIARVAGRLRTTPPGRQGYLVTSRGITNEAYYTIQKLARVLGGNNVDLCSRLCHAATVSGLKATLGYGAPTCSLSDMIGTDLLILIGTDLANNQPVTMKYIHEAKTAGTRVVVVNPLQETGLTRYWIPSIASSAAFGTKVMDDFFPIAIGGDVAFLNGVVKHLVAMNAVDRAFVDAHTSGYEDLRHALDAQSWEALETGSGLSRADMERLARAFASAKSAVLVYSMGLTQHRFGVDNVKAVVNLMLSRGMLGRPKCGIMPIRGHSGVQGGGEIGCEPNKLPGGDVDPANSARLSALWGAAVSAQPGLFMGQMLEACHAGGIDVLYNLGGNPLETMPDRAYFKEALERVPLRVHQDIVLNTAALLDAAEATVLLPAQTRYEQEGGGTATSTERRVRFTPWVPGRRVGEARAEWEIPCLIGRQAHPDGARLFPYRGPADVRREIAEAMPLYRGIETLAREGESFQWGGPYLYKDGDFAKMPEGRARFSALVPPDNSVPAGAFALTTRRGKQFNSMVTGDVDPLTAGRRDDVLMNRADAERRGLREGDAVTLRSSLGRMAARVRFAEVRPGTLQAYWPEANVLITRRYDPVSAEPDYNAIAWLEPPSPTSPERS